MALADQIVNRIYKCSNEICEAIIKYEQKCFDPWKTKCPYCKKNSLLIESGTLNISCIMDSTQPKTLGSLGEKNYYNAIRDGKDIGQEKNKKPFWRKKRNINFEVLKDPNKYVSTGTT